VLIFSGSVEDLVHELDSGQYNIAVGLGGIGSHFVLGRLMRASLCRLNSSNETPPIEGTKKNAVLLK